MKTKIIKTRNKKRKISWIKVLRLIGILLLAIVFMFAIYKAAAYLYEVGKTKVSAMNIITSSTTDNQNTASENEVKSIFGGEKEKPIINEQNVEEYVAKHMKLPDEQLTTMAKVKDPATLAEQSVFFKDVKKGDYVLVYPSVAIVYDPIDDKIIRTMSLK